MDNLSVHKSEQVRALIEVGGTIRILPKLLERFVLKLRWTGMMDEDELSASSVAQP